MVYSAHRQVQARATFQILEQSAYITNKPFGYGVSGKHSHSDARQTFDLKREYVRIAAYEPDYIRLDGSYAVMPEAKAAGDEFEYGWWSDVQSQEDGMFPASPTLPYISYQFRNPVDMAGFGLLFDVACRAFTITFTDSENSEILNIEEEYNESDYYCYESAVYGVTKISVRFTAHTKPCSRIRLIETDFGIVKQWGDDDIISLNIVDETSLTNETLPVSETKLVINNAGKQFNILNTAGVYGHLDETQTLMVEMGVSDMEHPPEWTKVCEHHFAEIQSDEGSMTATIIAKDIFYILDKTPYINTIADGSLKDLKSCMESALNAAGVAHEVDDRLSGVMTYFQTGDMNYRTLLQHAAIAGCVNVWADRDGKVILGRRDTARKDTVTLDNQYEEPQITDEGTVKSVRIEYNTTYGENPEKAAVVKTIGSSGKELSTSSPLINDSETAQAAADWLASQYKRYKWTVKWRQNPYLASGDTVYFENRWNESDTVITKQTLDYTGYLSGSTESAGD